MSDCGVGKTYTACAVAKLLKLPTLVIGPKISGSQWHSAAAHFDDEIDFIGYEMLRTGDTPYGTWERPAKPDREYFHCEICQQRVRMDAEYRPCPHHPEGFHCVVPKKVAWNRGKFIFNRQIKFLIFDEAHRCSGLDSLNAEMLIAAKRQGIMTLCLSATMACGPLQMRALGYLLDIHNLNTDIIGGKKSFFSWARSLGVWRDPCFHGLKWFAGESEQRQGMAKIRAAIIPERGVRVSTHDIPDFPECEIDACLYDLGEPSKIDALYAEMAEALERLKDKTASDKAPEHPLTAILRLRQRIELLKVLIFTELAQDYVDKGFSVGIFCNFRQTIEELSARLKTKCVIDGSPEGVRDRQKSIDSFQTNQERIILLNSEAGGIGISLHDLDGEHPRMGLVSLPQSAVTFRQLCGRFHRENGKSKSHYRIVLAAKTVEVKSQRVLRGKLNNLDILNDCDFQA